MSGHVITLQRFIIEEERRFPEATGDFTGLLMDITYAFKVLSREVNKAGIAEILGKTGDKNIQGEDVQRLDAFAQKEIYNAMDHGGHLCAMASEESDGIIPIPDRFPRGKYVLLFDPLDGSSNIDANVSIGTVFSIYRRITKGSHGTEDDCLQEGKKQVAAGYTVYGSSTMLVYTTGRGVHGFTLDPSIGEFILSHEDIRIPSSGRIYSINEGNYSGWDEGTRAFIDHVKSNKNKYGYPYSLRYIGSMVADFHRTLLKGGIFLYPLNYKNPENPKGKLRLLYEANPIAFIAEQAGGYATTGDTRILDIKPYELHQRVPLVTGSPEEVNLYKKFYKEQKQTVRADIPEEELVMTP